MLELENPTHLTTTRLLDSLDGEVACMFYCDTVNFGYVKLKRLLQKISEDSRSFREFFTYYLINFKDVITSLHLKFSSFTRIYKTRGLCMIVSLYNLLINLQ